MKLCILVSWWQDYKVIGADSDFKCLEIFEIQRNTIIIRLNRQTPKKY